MRIDLDSLKAYTLGVLKGSFQNKKELDKFSEDTETEKLGYGDKNIAYEDYVDATFDSVRTGEYLSGMDGLEDGPVGSVISFMSASTPKHYLPCDGDVYRIDEYTHLANFFMKHYGKVNYFGGDGITFFSVPSMVSDNGNLHYYIKYEPTYFMSFTGNSLQVSIMEDDPLLITCSTSTSATNQTILLNNEVTNFDYIEIVTTAVQSNQDVSTIRHRVKVSDLTYRAADDTKSTKGRIYLYHESQSTSTKCGFSCWFIDETHFFVYVAMTNSTSSWGKIRVDDIVGIKEDYKKNGIKADRTVLFDAGAIPFTTIDEPIYLAEDFTKYHGIRFTYTMNAVNNPLKYKSTAYIRVDGLELNQTADVFIGGFATRYFAGHFNDGDNSFTIDEVRSDLNDKIGLLKIEGLRYDEFDKDDALYINDDQQSGDTKSLWSSKKTYNSIKAIIDDEAVSLKHTWSSKKIEDEILDNAGATIACHW